MLESEQRDKCLALLESAITILFYLSMVLGATIIAYGMFTISTGHYIKRLGTGILSVAGAYVMIIGMSTMAQEAYSNLYDDIYKPRGVKLEKSQNGEGITVKARKMPKGTSLILATVDETNIADFHNSPREFRSADQPFKIEKVDSGIKLTNREYTELFEGVEFADIKLYLYRDSPQCRWVGDSIEVSDT